jgi:hypothetical protein
MDPSNREDVVTLIARSRSVDKARAGRIFDIEAASRTSIVRSIEEAEQSLAETATVRGKYTGIRPSGYFNPSAMRTALADTGRDAR